jgi:uncharacterized membrane protein (DUF2068 family)
MLRLIAVFKFLKAALLVAAAVGAFKLLHKNVGGLAEHYADALRLDPANHWVDMALSKAWRLRPEQIKKLGAGGLVYAGLFFSEGTGLWLQKLWGEWLTVIITSTLVPLEIYEICRHPSVLKVLVLVINVAIVIYLIHGIRKRKSNSTA